MDEHTKYYVSEIAAGRLEPAQIIHWCETQERTCLRHDFPEFASAWRRRIDWLRTQYT
jgi:hypothetical protein